MEPSESVISVRQSFSWCVCPCRAKERGWGWPTSWLSALPPVLVSYPEVRRAQPLQFPPYHSDKAWLPSTSLWTDSFLSVSWMVTSAWSWQETLGVWVSLAGAGREVKDPCVPTLLDWEETQCGPWDAPYAHLSSLLLPSVALDLNLPVHLWTSLSFLLTESSHPEHPLSCPAFSPLLSPSSHLSDCLFPCYSLGCAAWLSVGSSCGGEPHLCRSCAGWQCRPLCWRRLSATRKIPTSSSDWSFGTLPHLQLERGKERAFYSTWSKRMVEVTACS